MGAVQRDVGDVREQDAPGAMCLGLTVHEVFRRVVCSDGHLKLAVGVGFADGVAKFVLPHEPPDLLGVHSGSGVEQPHMDAPDALVIAAEPVGVQNELEIRLAPLLLALPGLLYL